MASNKPYEQYSQAGQDIYVTRILNKKQNGYFVEVGANNGIFLSNTYLLEKSYGWAGICVEATPYLYEILVENRPNSICVQQAIFSEEGLELDFSMVPIDILNALTAYADTAVEFLRENELITKLQTKTLTQILDENNAPNMIDYLSIDTNGTEPNVLQGIDFTKYTFHIITVEHSNIPEKQSKIDEILTANGYVLQQVIRFSDELCDNLYVHNSFIT